MAIEELGGSLPVKAGLRQRRETLQRELANVIAGGSRVESQSDTAAVVVKGRRINHLLHFFVGIFTLGTWWLVWIALALFAGERRHSITVDEYANITRKKVGNDVVRYALMGFIGLIVLGGVLAVVSSGGDRETTATRTASSAQSSSNNASVRTENVAPSGPAVAGIGGTQKVGDAEVTLHGVRTSAGSQFLTPQAGNVWVLVDVSAHNTGDDPYTLSSLLQTSIRDVEGRNYTLTFTTEQQGSFDGTMPVNGTIRGEVAFEVPSDSRGLQFVFGQALGTDQAFWSIQ